MFAIAYAADGAAATAPAGQTGGWQSYIMIIAILAIMYFVMIRPQSKRDKETKAMRNSLKPGDEIITIGGIVGTVARVKEDSDRVVILVGAERTKLEILKSAIAQKANPDEKAPTKGKSDKKEEEAEAPSKPNKKNIKKLGVAEEPAKEPEQAPEAQPEAPAEKTAE